MAGKCTPFEVYHDIMLGHLERTLPGMPVPEEISAVLWAYWRTASEDDIALCEEMARQKNEKIGSCSLLVDGLSSSEPLGPPLSYTHVWSAAPSPHHTHLTRTQAQQYQPHKPTKRKNVLDHPYSREAAGPKRQRLQEDEAPLPSVDKETAGMRKAPVATHKPNNPMMSHLHQTPHTTPSAPDPSAPSTRRNKQYDTYPINPSRLSNTVMDPTMPQGTADRDGSTGFYNDLYSVSSSSTPSSATLSDHTSGPSTSPDVGAQSSTSSNSAGPQTPASSQDFGPQSLADFSATGTQLLTPGDPNFIDWEQFIFSDDIPPQPIPATLTDSDNTPAWTPPADNVPELNTPVVWAPRPVRPSHLHPFVGWAVPRGGIKSMSNKEIRDRFYCDWWKGDFSSIEALSAAD